MQFEIKLVVTHNDTVIQTASKEYCKHGFVKSIEDFQIIANATITKLIEDSGDSGDCLMEEDADDSENENESISPKKKKT